MKSKAKNTFNAAAKRKKLDKIVREIRAFSEREFGPQDRHFAIVYGSYAYGLQTERSDIDIMFVSDNCSPARLQRCVDFVKDLHVRHGLPLDAEIRYENKALIPLDFMIDAVKGSGFQKDDGTFYIPKIEKTRACLDSVRLRKRFLHGMMTHKHVFVSGNERGYETLRAQARENLVRAVSSARDRRLVTADDLADVLMHNGRESGDFYLGFKDNGKQRAYLKELCAEILETLRWSGKAATPAVYDLGPLNVQPKGKKHAAR